MEKLKAIKRDIEKSYPSAQVLALGMDVTSKESIKETLTSLPKDFANVDILVNNAGLALGWDEVPTLADDTIDVTIDTNVKGLIRVTRAVASQMLERDTPATIINIGSIAGTQCYSNASVYCASKYAVHGFTKVLRIELVKSNIRVCEIMPGLVSTEFASVRFGEDSDRAKTFYDGLKALQAQDVAEMVVFVASRPDHVQISEIECLPVKQASVHHIYRDPLQKS